MCVDSIHISPLVSPSLSPHALWSDLFTTKLCFQYYACTLCRRSSGDVYFEAWGRLREHQRLLRTYLTSLNKQLGALVPLASPRVLLPLSCPCLVYSLQEGGLGDLSKPPVALPFVRYFLAAEAEHISFFFILGIFLFPISHCILVTKTQEDIFTMFAITVIATSRKQGTLRREGATGACLCQAVLLVSMGNWFLYLWCSSHTPQSGIMLPTFFSFLTLKSESHA